MDSNCFGRQDDEQMEMAERKDKGDAAGLDDQQTKHQNKSANKDREKWHPTETSLVTPPMSRHMQLYGSVNVMLYPETHLFTGQIL